LTTISAHKTARHASATLPEPDYSYLRCIDLRPRLSNLKHQRHEPKEDTVTKYQVPGGALISLKRRGTNIVCGGCHELATPLYPIPTYSNLLLSTLLLLVILFGRRSVLYLTRIHQNPKVRLRPIKNHLRPEQLTDRASVTPLKTEVSKVPLVQPRSTSYTNVRSLFLFQTNQLINLTH
jgi:hypothetical protein